jgi:hypothetical protein
MERSRIREEWEKKVIEIFQRQSGKDDVRVEYSRLSPQHPLTQPRNMLAILSVRGTKPYPGDLRERDRLLLMAIYNPNSNYLETFPFSIDDQVAMWEHVFRIMVLKEEKIRHLQRLQALIAEKLREAERE